MTRSKQTDREISGLRTVLRSLGPSTSAPKPREVIRAALGTMAGLVIIGLMLTGSGVDLHLGFYLIAPFGATAVLVFAAPSSPLAQPWSAIVGNTLSAVIGVASTLLITNTTARIAVAVGVSVVVMALVRAVHPPAGAVAMTAALSPDAIHTLGFRFAIAPVLVGTCLLVALAVLYGRATGRRYPSRQLKSSPPPPERLGLSEGELTHILERYQQSLNLGVADLARLVGAAELQAAGHRAEPLVAGDVMSGDLVTVRPDASLDGVADLFRKYGFTSLPVVGDDGRFAGVVFQIHLILCLQDSASNARGIIANWRRNGHDVPERRATDIMAVDTASASVDTPIAALLPLLSASNCDAVPVLDGDAIVGIVTQTDLIAALARQTLSTPAGPA